MSEDARDKVWQARANELKKPVDEQVSFTPWKALVTFHLGEKVYALEAEYVKKVKTLKQYTPLPLTPSFIMGIISEESRILALVDLKKFFDLKSDGITNYNRVIIVEDNGIEFGILADDLLGREEIDQRDIHDLVSEPGNVSSQLILGVTPQKVIVLNTRNLIADKRLEVNEEIDNTSRRV